MNNVDESMDGAVRHETDGVIEAPEEGWEDFRRMAERMHGPRVAAPKERYPALARYLENPDRLSNGAQRAFWNSFGRVVLNSLHGITVMSPEDAQELLKREPGWTG